MSDVGYLDLPEVMAMLEGFNALVKPKLVARETEKMGKHVFVLFVFFF